LSLKNQLNSKRVFPVTTHFRVAELPSESPKPIWFYDNGCQMASLLF
jgi:hypothetical protein